MILWCSVQYELPFPSKGPRLPTSHLSSIDLICLSEYGGNEDTGIVAAGLLHQPIPNHPYVSEIRGLKSCVYGACTVLYVDGLRRASAPKKSTGWRGCADLQ